MNAKPFLPLLLLAGACTSAPQIVREPHPDQNAYRWQPLFDKTLSNAEFKPGAWHYDANGYLTPLLDEPIWTKADWENYVLYRDWRELLDRAIDGRRASTDFAWSTWMTEA